MKAITLIFFILIFICSSPASAKIYKYVDEDGNTRITDDLGNVPENQRAQFEEDGDDVEENEEEDTDTDYEIEIEDTDMDEEGYEEGDEETDETDGEDNWPVYEEPVKDDVSLDDQRELLNATGKELQNEFDAIQKDKEDLKKMKKDATTPETIKAYNDKARSINERAEKFKKRKNNIKRTWMRITRRFRN